MLDLSNYDKQEDYIELETPQGVKGFIIKSLDFLDYIQNDISPTIVPDWYIGDTREDSLCEDFYSADWVVFIEESTCIRVLFKLQAGVISIKDMSNNSELCSWKFVPLYQDTESNDRFSDFYATASNQFKHGEATIKKEDLIRFRNSIIKNFNSYFEQIDKSIGYPVKEYVTLYRMNLETLCLEPSSEWVETFRKGTKPIRNMGEEKSVYLEHIFNKDCIPVNWDNLRYKMSGKLIEILEAKVALSTKVKEIMGDCFTNVSVPLKITLHEGINIIHKNAFTGKTFKELKLPSSLRIIGEQAFSGACIHQDIVIPKNVSKIEAGAFENLRLSPSITFEEGSCLSELGEVAFLSCKGIKEIKLPEPLKRLNKNVFQSCINLETIQFSSQIEEIDECCFHNCSKLNNVVLPPKVTRLGMLAFGECVNLSDIKLNDGLIDIEVSVFKGCEKLTSLELPDSIETLDSSFVKGCSIESLKLPPNIQGFRFDAFESIGKIICTEEQLGLFEDFDEESSNEDTRVLTLEDITYNVQLV